MPDTPASPALVVLAAGLGSRFGGLKQLAGVGPGGASLLEYSLFDARRAGFGRVVFVIRPEMQSDFRSFAESRLPDTLNWQICLQRLDVLPSSHVAPVGRTRPWGTAHAVLAAEALVDSSFAVVNADDFYGHDAFTAMATFLGASAADWALVGYRIADTLSDAGGVNRGVLSTRSGGMLSGIEEVMDIERRDDGAIVGLGEVGPRVVPGGSLVSMNCWGFTPAVFGELHAGFERFLHRADLGRDEFPLPVAIQEILARRDHQVRVLSPGSRWFGMTYRDDLPAVRKALEELTAGGHYPERLWS